MGIKKLTRLFKGDEGFDAVDSYDYIADLLRIDLKTENKIYSLDLSIGLMNKELAGETGSQYLYKKYDVFYSYRSYLPMAFYLFLKMDYFKEGKYFEYYIVFYETYSLKRQRYIAFEEKKIFYERISPIVFYFSPFLIALCSLLPNFKSDKIIFGEGYMPEWV
ncbi:MAG: hypothetical protein LWW95_11965 [Candidatus Desulfofervidus auxilii]|nr:hypothetical protein [Candidatus Desulfofervidus auxilii]